jgi:hypothetical protein
MAALLHRLVGLGGEAGVPVVRRLAQRAPPIGFGGLRDDSVVCEDGLCGDGHAFNGKNAGIAYLVPDLYYL